MKTENTKSSKLMELIVSQHSKDKEFFKEKYNRGNFKRATLETLGLDNEKGKNLYSVIYKRFLKKKKIYNDDYTNTRFRRDLKDSEFGYVKITAKPSGITEPIKTPVEKIKEEIKYEHPRLASDQKQELDSDLEHFEGSVYLIPEESISIFWDGVWQLMKLKWSMIEEFTQEERKSLGKMWQPFFEKYTSEKFILLGIPTIMTFGILGKHIREARKIRKENKLKEEKKEGSE